MTSAKAMRRIAGTHNTQGGQMELIFIRHALPVSIDRPAQECAPAANPGLSTTGRIQAVRLAEFLTSEPVEAVYASPTRRAIETAAPLAESSGVPTVIDAGLAEWDVTSPSYIPVEDMKELGDPRWEALRRGVFYDDSADPGAFRRRVVTCVESILQHHGDELVALFTHAGTINAYAGHVLGQENPFWMPLPRSPGYCSITRMLACNDGSRRVLSLNETGHVRDLLDS
jgi:broad specificity phosphatase PhoE